jgi:hypothetical protein
MSEIVNPAAAGGSGTVTTVSVVTANGFQGSVANPTTTPAITLNAGTPPTSWTPTDQSGASLSFTAVSAQYTQIGNMVFAYGTLTYPTTADGSAAKISLPVAVPNQAYAAVDGAPVFDGTNNVVLKTVINTQTAAFFVSGTGAAVLNSSLSTKVLNFMLVYPAS